MGEGGLPPLRPSTKQINFELYESKWRKIECQAELKIQEVPNLNPAPSPSLPLSLAATLLPLYIYIYTHHPPPTIHHPAITT